MSDAFTATIVALGESAELTLLAKVTLVLAGAIGIGRLAARTRASLRHLVLATSLLIAIALPIAAAVAPPTVVGVPVLSAPSAPAAPPDRPQAGPAGTSAEPSASRERPLSVPAMVRLAWSAGALGFTVPLIVAWHRLRHLRRTALPWTQGTEFARGLAADAGISRRVDVLLHEAAVTPFTFGALNPTILLPPDAREWAADDLRRTLVHELEHVARADWTLQVTGRLACAAYWFHPLAWAAWRQMNLEAERACDDAVVVKEENVDYADQLVSLAERLSASHAQPALGMAHRSDLTERVRALLNPAVARGRAGLPTIAAASGVAVLVVALVAPVRAVAIPAAAAMTASPTPAATAPVPSPASQGRLQRGLDRELFEAADAGDLGGVIELLDAGANPNAALPGDGSPLIAAVGSGRIEIVRLLLDRGATPDLAVPGDGSALIAAASMGYVDIAALLLDRGANVDAVVPGDENPLINAAAEGHMAVVRLLVSRGADVNVAVRVTNFRGQEEVRTPLSMARRGGHPTIVSYLISAGARE